MTSLLWLAFYAALALGFAQRRHYEAEIKWRDGSIAQLIKMTDDWAAHCEGR